ncbi:hypothetical protein ACJW30_11G019900 [Castanea mollissima]
MATYGGSSSSNPTRMVTFITSDGEEVKVPVAIAMEFKTMIEFLEGDLDRPEVENAPFPLSNVDSQTLRQIVILTEARLRFRLQYEALEKERLVELPSKYEALEIERVLLPSKYQALEIAREFELPSKYLAFEKERQKFETEFFGRQSDEAIVKLVKAADFLEIKELLDSVMPSFRKRFGLGDDKGVDFVYSAEAEEIFRRRAAPASVGAST